MDAGALVPNDLIIGLMKEKIKEVDGGVLLDGFPRTVEQADALGEVMKVDLALNFDVPDEELIKRILLRGQLSGRADDNEETARKRLEVYYNQTSPLKAYYEEQGKYLAINLFRIIKGLGKRQIVG